MTQNRLNAPLRRTNPEKGLYADPKWKEISWEEALDEIAGRLKKVLDDDPRKILLQSTTMRALTGGSGWRRMLSELLGTRNISAGGGGIDCGNGSHVPAVYCMGLGTSCPTINTVIMPYSGGKRRPRHWARSDGFSEACRRGDGKRNETCSI